LGWIDTAPTCLTGRFAPTANLGGSAFARQNLAIASQ
jgi:hypothetical protein